MELDGDENDSFNKLLNALYQHGFKPPWFNDVFGETFVRLTDAEVTRRNREALISALTDSGWVAG